MPNNVFNTLLRPVFSEKATFLNGLAKYIFIVQKSANKESVKKAVESVFGVDVVSVNIISKKGKKKRFKGREGKRPDLKKAVVSLKSGQSIESLSGE